jgi:hypothetical protein
MKMRLLATSSVLLVLALGACGAAKGGDRDRADGAPDAAEAADGGSAPSDAGDDVAAGVPPAIITDEVVQGGATLQEQWNNGLAQTRITTEQWTHVVLQGQTEEAAAGPGEGGPNCNYEALGFWNFAPEFGNLIISANARPTLFASWAWATGAPLYDPSSMCWFSRDEMQDWITFNYAEVGRQLPGSLLSCVGEAFRASLRDHPEIVLIQSDFNHATVAGTYLAASTFYVALTGNPVPPASEVPSEVSLQDAALLRQEALVGAKVGANCAEVHPQAYVVLEDCTASAGGGYACNCASGNACQPVEFGVAGTSIPQVFLAHNIGWGTAGITDGLTLASPFAWTSGAYPGGSGAVSAFGAAEFCSTSLPAGASCALSVSYDGTTAGSGTLTLTLTDAYSASVARELHGSPTKRALLTISEGSGFFGCTDTSGYGPAGLWAVPDSSAPLDLVVSRITPCCPAHP